MTKNLKHIEEILTTDLDIAQIIMNDYAEDMSEENFNKWMKNFYDVMNDRSYFAMLGRGREYSNPSKDTTLRLKLYTLYEIIDGEKGDL